MFIQSTAFNEKDFNSYIEGVQDILLDTHNGTIQVAACHLEQWEELSRYLELTDTEVEEIEHNYSQNYKEQKYQCIKCWVKKNRESATLKNLLRKIYFNLKDKSVVMRIVDDLQHGSKQPSYICNYVCMYKSIKYCVWSNF